MAASFGRRRDRLSVSLFFCFLGFFILSGRVFSQDWQELSGEHFLVYYSMDNERLAKEILDKAEFYYRDIATELGYPRYSQFWTWDKRVKIYIYPNRNSFLKATGQPQWSEGMADYNAKAIISYAWSQGFLDSLLPHEMAHLIFRDFVGFKGEIPLWLDEGVAQWAESPKRAQMKAMAKHLFESDSILSVEDMMKVDIRKVTSTDRIYIRSTRTKDGDRGILFLSGNSLVSTYYLQSVSLVGFLIERFGSLAFASFCRELRDGKTLEEAIKSAYSDHMRSLLELEGQWRDYLGKQ